jgi:ATP-dependent Zn protease
LFRLPDFTQAIKRVIAGLEKRNRLLNPHEREVVAYHKVAHALVAITLPGVDPIQKISIIPRGIGALGFTMQRPLEDRFLMSRAELTNRMTVLLGGHVARRPHQQSTRGATLDRACFRPGSEHPRSWRAALRKAATTLLERETLSGAELRELVALQATPRALPTPVIASPDALSRQ